LVSGAGHHWRGIATTESRLFVSDWASGIISEYTLSGQLINPSLISGLQYPEDIEVYNGHLYVTSRMFGAVGEYTLAGVPVNPALIPWPEGTGTYGIAIVPEPPASALMAAGLSALLLFGRSVRARCRPS
jgi:hypothetical protein